MKVIILMEGKKVYQVEKYSTVKKTEEQFKELRTNKHLKELDIEVYLSDVAEFV